MIGKLTYPTGGKCWFVRSDPVRHLVAIRPLCAPSSVIVRLFGHEVRFG